MLQTAAQACDSMKDGPFCRALPETGMARHRPFTLDSIVPQHLFGDPQASSERSKAQDMASAEQATKQATNVLNRFLEHFSKIKDAKDARLRSVAREGRLDFRRLPMSSRPGSFSRSFSRGLPGLVVATWEGAWQVEPAVDPPKDWMNKKKKKRKEKPRAALRLNGVIGAEEGKMMVWMFLCLYTVGCWMCWFICVSQPAW